ncbi:DNA utilization protein HofQ [Vibrio halioticoli NBRC 102217]|uniref:DNA utilization protein HofQ n=1 Tax=Vibrio halioticoli NBRC 102217 TaxID=1219072 RepID=V5FAB6_9VIBR|nr:type IV pilus secretin PilQ [Vibrio sp. B1Z05]GAD88013.1 DNA utilization protein HofQ [Vibrio halioticoli NBRC 102217]
MQRTSFILILWFFFSSVLAEEQQWFSAPAIEVRNNSSQPAVAIAPSQPELTINPLEALNTLTLHPPLSSQLFAIKYAKASDIADILDHHRRVGTVSEFGSIAVDDRTNSLLIYDHPDNLVRIVEIIESLDIPVKQVQIEARIVTINEGELDELGVRWGFSNINTDSKVTPSIEASKGSTDLVDHLNVNLGLANPNASTIAFQLAKLGSDTLLDLELSALQAESRAEIISSPRLVTTNKQAAYIEQGSEIPYLEAASSGATSISFRKAVLSLKVVPQITPDNHLVLDLIVTQDRPGQVVKTGIGESVAIDTQRVQTQVLVENGETIVLGGIYQKSIIRNVEKVPYLSDIPWFGRFFKRTSDKFGRSELLIFVTPSILFPKKDKI